MKAGKLLVVVAVLGMSISAFGAGEAAPASGEMFGGVGYTYWTDYMWRGMNMTQLIGNNKGAGANQMIYTVGVDVADLGKVGVSVEQVYFNRWDGTSASLAFTNMNVFLKHAIDGSDSSVTVGYGNHFWENLRNFTGKDARSQEFYATYAFSDACLWQGLTGKETGNVLNPSLTYLVDTDKADGGSLFLLGLSHPMNMADVDPSMAGITVVPTFLMVVDNRYYSSYIESVLGVENDDTTKIAYMDYGVKAMADMTEMAGLTDGKLGLSIGVGYLDGVELPDAKWYGTAGISYNF
jgi:hypothetical protein